MIPPRPTTVVFAIEGPIARTDLPGLCDRVCGLLARSGASVAVCEVGGVGVDAVTVDALARLQLAARRYGCEVRLRHASEELRDLVAFMGLTHVLPDWSEAAGGAAPLGSPSVELDADRGAPARARGADGDLVPARPERVDDSLRAP